MRTHLPPCAWGEKNPARLGGRGTLSLSAFAHTLSPSAPSAGPLLPAWSRASPPPSSVSAAERCEARSYPDPHPPPPWPRPHPHRRRRMSSPSPQTAHSPPAPSAAAPLCPAPHPLHTPAAPSSFFLAAAAASLCWTAPYPPPLLLRDAQAGAQHAPRMPCMDQTPLQPAAAPAVYAAPAGPSAACPPQVRPAPPAPLAA
mmetsp:Transcript_13666/g.30647  ORF Transcript_13666/g.30647 Transcript_13666/m.30647 type:complete len:200 (+) Transcript_13666:235-834(+)